MRVNADNVFTYLRRRTKTTQVYLRTTLQLVNYNVFKFICITTKYLIWTSSQTCCTYILVTCYSCCAPVDAFCITSVIGLMQTNYYTYYYYFNTISCIFRPTICPKLKRHNIPESILRFSLHIIKTINILPRSE